MLAGDVLYGVSAVSYGSQSAMGLEVSDVATFANNVLTFDFPASDPGDHIRVLTRVPEPSSLALLALGLSAMGVASRRRRHR